MPDDELKQLITQVAELLEYFKRQTEKASESNSAASLQLQQAAAAAPAVIREAASDALTQVSKDVADTMHDNLQIPMNDFARRLMEAEHHVAKTMQVFAERLITFQKSILLTLGLMAIAAILLIAGAAGGVWYSHKEVERNRVEADLLRAYNQADVTICEDRLCAKIDKSGKHYGNYVPVAPR
ncbi:MAG TPA: hypothetical protein VF472_19735 [Burkholderiaceae bacterium]